MPPQRHCSREGGGGPEEVVVGVERSPVGQHGHGGVQPQHVLQRAQRRQREVPVPGRHQVEDARVEVEVDESGIAADVLGLVAGHGQLGALRRALDAGDPVPALGQVVLVVDLLARRAALGAQLGLVAVGARVEHLLGHVDGEGEVAADLAHDDGGGDVVHVDLHVAVGLHLHQLHAAVGAVRRVAVLEGSGQRVRLCLVRVVVVRPALRVALHDHRQLQHTTNTHT